MKLVKFSHACVRLEQDDRAIVIDPGRLSEAAQALQGAHGVLITHEHVDHVDEDAINTAMRENAALRLWAPNSVVPAFKHFGERVITVQPHQRHDMAGFRVTTHGGQHALIHPKIPLVTNVGYVINETLYHPGDSFIVPNVPVSHLLVPLHAPWSKFSEVADFLIAVRPQRATQIHDGLLNSHGIGFVEGNLQRVLEGFDIEFRMMQAGEAAEI
jgi:L-ascorbate metabolism protein UlaG (beta-lactamase superfamily)